MTATGKRRNSEKRKEKSRDAARCRRGKETEVFSELAKELPLPPCLNQLDKASVMRVAISHLKIRQIMDKMNVQDLESNETLEDVDNLYGKALDGFVVIISDNCDLAYVSESVAKYLGIPQIDMIGQSLYDFTHPCDHEEIGDMMLAKSHKGMEEHVEEHTIFVRMKCTLTSKGRSVNLKSASYKVIKFTGKLTEVKDERVVRKEEDEDDEERDDDTEQEEEDEEAVEKEPRRTGYFLGVGEPIPHPSNIEVLLDCKTVLSRHNMDAKFTYCDSRMKELVGYSGEELIGKSIFSYHHAQDSRIIDKAYKDLFAKGQMMTGQYRFLVKQGGYVWVITQATVIYNSRTQKPQCIVCVHYVTSGVEQDNLILSDVQHAQVKKEVKKDVKEVIQWSFGPSTKDVFVKKTDEDEKAEFYFSENVPKSCLKQMDLQHLAPMAGDACVPLDTTFFKGQAKQEEAKDLEIIVLKEEPTMTLCRGQDPKMISPTSTACSTPITGSPMHSPTPPITDDFLITINPADIVAMDQFFTTMDMTQMQMSEGCLPEEDIDMDTRAPYIPMDSSNDFCLLPPAPDELFNLNGDFNPGLFGRTESVFTPRDKLFTEEPQQKRPCLWDMLEGSTTVATIECPVDYGMMKMKRPLDKTNLENGPPKAKRTCPDIGTKTLNRGHLGSDSVLMNLLLTGEDRSYGYSVYNTHNEKSAKSPKIKQLLSSTSKWSPKKCAFLPKITQHDCEVNAPSHPNDGLLQGEAIIQALDRDAFPLQII